MRKIRSKQSVRRYETVNRSVWYIVISVSSSMAHTRSPIWKANFHILKLVIILYPEYRVHYPEYSARTSKDCGFKYIHIKLCIFEHHSQTYNKHTSRKHCRGKLFEVREMALIMQMSLHAAIYTYYLYVRDSMYLCCARCLLCWCAAYEPNDKRMVSNVNRHLRKQHGLLHRHSLIRTQT